MGSGRWDPGDWKDYTKGAGYDKKTVDEVFTSRKLVSELDPKGVTRESRDSADNPNSTPLIVGLDVTGSMSMVLDSMAKKGLNTLVTEVYNRKPIHDPHILCAGIGDVEAGDRAPLQVTQFEADIRIAKQLEKLFLERGGGGNSYESYMLMWYFAAKHTKTDSFEKRGKRGYLFTVGDEFPTPYLHATDIEKVLGTRPERDVDVQELLTEVTRTWEVFHVMVAEGDAARTYPDQTRQRWTNLIGQNALWLEDHHNLAELVVSVLQLREGHDRDEVIKSWDGSTAMVVDRATKGLTKNEGAAVGSVTL